MVAVPVGLRLILELSKALAHGDWLDVSGIEDEDGNVLAVYTGTYELREVDLIFKRVVSAGAPVQDNAMCTFHLLNLTSGAPDATWTAGDYTACETLFDTFWGAIKAQYSLGTAFLGYRWSADGPAFKPHGSELSPTLRNTARSVLGSTDTEFLPPQVAVSVTEVTAAKYTVDDVEGVGTQLRNRWGRFYLPAPIVAAAVNGRLSSAAGTAIANAAQSLYNGLRAADFIPVMYSPTTGSSWSVDELHVDDIFDVIRSRRFVTPLTRNTRTLT